MNIEEAKNNLFETINSIDKDKLSLSDLKIYAEILKTISEIHSKNYMDSIIETMNSCAGFNSKAATIGEMKGE